MRPVVITQPGGHSFDTAGYEVRWLNFKMRIGWNPREGLYLNTITFKYNDIIHPLIYRMSLSEVYLQYGDPRPPYHSKAVSSTKQIHTDSDFGRYSYKILLLFCFHIVNG